MVTFAACRPLGPRVTSNSTLEPSSKASISLRLNRGEVYEYIFAVLPLNKAIPLGCVKPLHCSFFFHLCFLYAVMQRPWPALRIKQKGVAAGLHRQPP